MAYAKVTVDLRKSFIKLRHISAGNVRLSVCTSRHCTTTAKHRVTRTTPYDSPWTLFFCCQRYWRNSNGVTPTGAPNRGGGRLQSAIIDQYLAIS